MDFKKQIKAAGPVGSGGNAAQAGQRSTPGHAGHSPHPETTSDLQSDTCVGEVGGA